MVEATDLSKAEDLAENNDFWYGAPWLKCAGSADWKYFSLKQLGAGLYLRWSNCVKWNDTEFETHYDHVDLNLKQLKSLYRWPATTGWQWKSPTRLMKVISAIHS
jgi:hypothetical protein